MLTPSPPAQSALAGQPSGQSVSLASRRLVFTIPKILRGIFRKRRDLLHLLSETATDTLLESFRARLNLPDGRLAAVAAGHPF
ncbi:MAG: hypothetical protein NTW21_00165 [Verrucomicrobia bacterium]|nr:hypothetical protein [Verrucomicrobiota bacterium]